MVGVDALCLSQLFTDGFNKSSLFGAEDSITWTKMTFKWYKKNTSCWKIRQVTLDITLNYSE